MQARAASEICALQSGQAIRGIERIILRAGRRPFERHPGKGDSMTATIDELLQAAVDRALQARVDELQRPELVHQRNVEAVVGLPRRDYLRLARDGAFPSTRERRLVIARAVDVVAVFARRLVRVTHRASANDGSEASSLARVGARRVAP